MSNDNTSPSKGSKKKKKKKSSSLNKILKITVLVLLFVILVGASVAFGTAYAWIKSAKPLDYSLIFDLNQTTYIVDKNDKLIDKLHFDENRSMVSLDEIPVMLQNAFIAIEDKRFWKHNGIDPYRILGAIKADIKSGDKSQGGSTITQQLIKNIYLTPDKLFKRKVIEMYYAIQLERHYTKEQILEAYLNRIDFSNNISGVKEAALFYFGKDLNQLTLAECAMLAGVTNNPSRYAPNLNFESSNQRKEKILKAMLDQKLIGQTEYDEAINQEIVLNKVQREVETSYFTDLIKRDVTAALVEKLGISEEEATRKLYNGGLKIVATIDPDIQNIIDETYKNPDWFVPNAKVDGNEISSESAFVIVENGTGEIKAIRGGREEKVKMGFNRAIQAKRQPGSSIKPLSVYTPALDNGYTAATVIDDSPTIMGKYIPHNYTLVYKGLTTVRDALKGSINAVAAKILLDIGPTRSIDYLNKFGLTTIVNSGAKNDKDIAPLALGALTYGVKPLEMAAAYSVFPNKGILVKPISFTQVLDSNGNVIIDNKPEMEKVVSPQVAYLMVDLMKGVVKAGGTAPAAALKNMPVAGKTGTTSDYKDAWFIGYTPYYTAALWMGYDEPRTLYDSKGRNVTGGSLPAKLWHEIMTKVHENLEYKDFPNTNNIVTVDICTQSGQRPSELCALDPRGSTVRSEIFIKGTEPAEDNICTVHVTKDIDIESNQLASPYCPITFIQSKVFIQRPVPFVPIPGEKDPEDLIYEAPTEVCQLHSPPLDENGNPILPPSGDGTNTDITPTPTPDDNPFATPSPTTSPVITPSPTKTPTVTPTPTPTTGNQ